jgi:hypothetical protein
MRTVARALAMAALAAGALVILEGPAAAHVHGFTPLGCLTTDNANSGALVGFVQAAEAAAPLNGPTQIIPLNASGSLPSGGEGAEHACG